MVLKIRERRWSRYKTWFTDPCRVRELDTVSMEGYRRWIGLALEMRNACSP